MLVKQGYNAIGTNTRHWRLLFVVLDILNFEEEDQAGLNVGNRTYHEVLLIKHNEGYSNSIDSLFLANDTGIVGFNYFGEKYILQ